METLAPFMTQFLRFARLYLPTFLNIVVATTWFLALADTARADVPDRIRVMTAAKKFSGTELVAAAYTGGAPKWIGAHHLEWSIGVLHGAGDVRPQRPFLTTLTSGEPS